MNQSESGAGMRRYFTWWYGKNVSLKNFVKRIAKSREANLYPWQKARATKRKSPRNTVGRKELITYGRQSWTEWIPNQTVTASTFSDDLQDRDWKQVRGDILSWDSLRGLSTVLALDIQQIHQALILYQRIPLPRILDFIMPTEGPCGGRSRRYGMHSIILQVPWIFRS